MAVVKLVEPYAVTQLRKDVRDAMMMAGEQAVLLQLYHSGDKDAEPCPQCGDPLYRSPEMDCMSCYGTTFNGGVRTAMKVWSLFTDHDVAEQRGPRGEFQPDQRSVTFEAFPMVTEHDILVRVSSWTNTGAVGTVEGFYMLQKLQRRSLRTGNRFGQANWDVVSQKAQVSELPNTMRGITRYAVAGKIFNESVQLQPTTVPPSAKLMPDTKVIYFPFEQTTGGVTPGVGGGGGSEPFVFTQNYAVATWTILHNLGYQPSVSLVVGDEEVEAEVDYPDVNTVVVTFSAPQRGIARLT